MPKRLALFVSPHDEDQWSLIHILQPEGWSVDTARTCAEAMRSLEMELAPVVIVESHLADGTWKTLQNRLMCMELPPKLFVTSRLADERLWAEALNRGCFDVLAQPFRGGEVRRCISSACRHWHEERPAANDESEVARVMTA